MLQVARLASSQLGDARDKVVEFLFEELADDGGAKDRSGKSDLYYTAFLLEGLLALRADLPVERVRPYLARFELGDALDIVHRACLVRCWAALGEWPAPEFAQSVAVQLEAGRSADGGYGSEPGKQDGTLYNAFLTLGAYQDLGLELPDHAALDASLDRLRTKDGGYANALDLPWGTTPSTAAVVAVKHQLGLTLPSGVADWMLTNVHAGGGFMAMPEAPIPDLLSTATALHALSTMQVPFGGLQELCLDYIDTLWTGRAFVGHWQDDQPDCEYVFYALLALGHLSL